MCCFAGFFKLILRSGPFQKINVSYIYYIYICIYAPPHTTFLFLFITFEFHLKWFSASSSPHRGRCSRLQTFKYFSLLTDDVVRVRYDPDRLFRKSVFRESLSTQSADSPIWIQYFAHSSPVIQIKVCI